MAKPAKAEYLTSLTLPYRYTSSRKIEHPARDLDSLSILRRTPTFGGKSPRLSDPEMVGVDLCWVEQAESSCLMWLERCFRRSEVRLFVSKVL
jgi:hypothetical protein